MNTIKIDGREVGVKQSFRLVQGEPAHTYILTSGVLFLKGEDWVLQKKNYIYNVMVEIPLDVALNEDIFPSIKIDPILDHFGKVRGIITEQYDQDEDTFFK